MQGSFASSSTSLPAGGEKKAKRNLLKRVTLRPKTALNVSTSSSAFDSPAAEFSPRRASEMFVRDASRQTMDMGKGVPSTPKSARSTGSFDAKSLAAPATRTTTAAASKSKGFCVKSDAPPVPYVPKSYLISDEIFVIANLPSVAEDVAPTPRISESSSAPSSYSMMSSTSSQSSASWLDDLENIGFPSPPSGDSATFSPMYIRCGSEAEGEPTRSSLDDIDDQIVLNLCLNLCDDTTPTGLTPTEMVRDTTSTQSHRRTPSAGTVLPEGLSRPSHARTASAPLSLGPLPPQPTQAPAEAVLRKTNAIKKRYSKQVPSPMLSSQTNSPALGSGKEDATCYFSAPRAAPSMHRLDSISSLKTIEADLSHDSKMVKKIHQRSASKHSIASEQDFSSVPRHVELTTGRGAAHKTVADFETEVEEHNLRSRWSEDSEDGGSGVEEVRRLFSSLLSPKLGSAPKMTPSLSSYYTIAERDSSVSGTKTPDMISVRHSSSSSSSNSSVSDLSDLTIVAPASTQVKAVEDEQETLFDLSRASLDYRSVYALAQQYAASSNNTSPAPSRKPSLRRASTLKVNSKGGHKFSSLLPNAGASRSLRGLALDPVDRTYHLRK